MSPGSPVEQDKRVRREIANSNERRRMQSINTGFQSLKVLIPHSCGEKLSKACILQRAAEHIKALESEKLKLQAQNEQFRLLIKSFQIDSTSILQGKRRLSTADELHSLFDEVKPHPTYWHAQYIPTEEPAEPFYHPPSSADTTYMIVQQNQPSPRCYKTNSLDQPATAAASSEKKNSNNNNNNNIVIVERCQVRAQSIESSAPSTVSRRNLQTIVEAIRHLEGEDALANLGAIPRPPVSQQQQEELPAQLKAMISETFQQSIRPREPAQTSSAELEPHQRPPKKRKITFTEHEELTASRPPISSPEVHHHEQISCESSPPPSPLQPHARHRPAN